MNHYNIITCILSIIDDRQKIVASSHNTHNSLQAIGEPLETYIKDAFSGAIGLKGVEKKKRHKEAFSYGGGINNPPDAILKNGDAIEVKKVESIGNIPLNSSYPKSHLYSDDIRISKACRNIENGEWKVKDIIYAIGRVDKNNKKLLKSLVFVYGSIYCADKEHYERIFNAVKQSIDESTIIKELGIVLEETSELAHINKVDPLGITYFRARAMWGITHPFLVKEISEIFEFDKNSVFELMAIIPTEKFEAFDNKDELIALSKTNKRLIIEDSEIENPNNLAELTHIKLIKYKL